MDDMIRDSQRGQQADSNRAPQRIFIIAHVYPSLSNN